MDFITTSTFREAFNKLTKRNENGYSSCKEDITKAFLNQSFDSIFDRNTRLFGSNQFRMIKIRIPISSLNSSSSQGFRLYIACNRKHNHIAFPTIYPKKGKYSKMNLDPGEDKMLLEIYKDEFEKNICQSF